MASKAGGARLPSRRSEIADLNISDLGLLIEIHRHGRLADAAERLQLSQPSISLRLARLRKHFDDALFIRGPRGMLPTPRMNELIPVLRQAAGLLEEALAPKLPFVAASSRRVFRLCLTDMGQSLVLPRLIRRLQNEAPETRLEVLNFDGSTPELLQTGAADLAIGVLRFDPPPALRQQKLIGTDFICVCRRGHPRIRDSVSRAEYLREAHVAVIYPGRAEAAFDRMLSEADIARKVTARVPSSIAIGEIVESSDLLAIVPRLIGERLVAERRIKLVELPMPVRSFPVNQYWHTRYHREPALVWLRTLIFDLFAPERGQKPSR